MMMKKIQAARLALFATLLLACDLLPAQSAESTGITGQDVRKRTLPFGAEWASKKGIDLPSPFGISGFYTYMTRDIDITDVTVQFLDRQPESISNFASFAVRNKTSVTAIKLDTWVLPVLNVYILAGYAYTNSGMNATVTINRSILPLPPVELEIQAKTPVKGPYGGIGSTFVAGYKNWFILADANWGRTAPDKVDNYLTFTMLSIRSGFSGKIGVNGTLRGWLGTMYMDSKSTLEITAPSDVLGEVLVRIDQHPVNPWTIQCGFMVGVSKHFEFMTELGTNFNDASISVLTATYRF